MQTLQQQSPMQPIIESQLSSAERREEMVDEDDVVGLLVRSYDRIRMLERKNGEQDQQIRELMERIEMLEEVVEDQKRVIEGLEGKRRMFGGRQENKEYQQQDKEQQHKEQQYKQKMMASTSDDTFKLAKSFSLVDIKNQINNIYLKSSHQKSSNSFIKPAQLSYTSHNPHLFRATAPTTPNNKSFNFRECDQLVRRIQHRSKSKPKQHQNTFSSLSSSFSRNTGLSFKKSSKHTKTHMRLNL